MDIAALAMSVKHVDSMQNVSLAMTKKNDGVSARKCGTISRSDQWVTPHIRSNNR